MHPFIPLTLASTLLVLSPVATAQPAAPQGIPGILRVPNTPAGPEVPPLPRFDLIFPGGTPKQLLVAIETQSGNLVNAIIPPELANTELPPMNLRGVTLPDLFEAVVQASARVQRSAGPPGYPVQDHPYSHGFITADSPPREESVWVFFRRGSSPEPAAPPQSEPQSVRVLNLSHYLENHTVEDITTAIRTACEMLPGGGQPKLTFHKETNLLMTRGRADQLDVIGMVLQQLGAAPRPAKAGVALPAPFPAPPPLVHPLPAARGEGRERGAPYAELPTTPVPAPGVPARPGKPPETTPAPPESPRQR